MSAASSFLAELSPGYSVQNTYQPGSRYPGLRGNGARCSSRRNWHRPAPVQRPNSTGRVGQRLHGAVVALDLALGLGMVGCAANVVHLVVLEILFQRIR